MKLIGLIVAALLLLLLASPALALKVGEDAPLFSLWDGTGSYFHLSDYIGEKKKEPVKGLILNFFSSTCGPCKNELPVLNSLVDEFEKKGIKIVIIGYKEDFDKFMDMLDKLKVDKPVILSDRHGKAGEKYGVYGLPHTVFIDSKGKVRDIIRGELPNIGKVLREKAKKLLK
ncbi:MAG: TlpA family protein disulfide reductase [Nitrospirae bacterium]|nr:MAG: TlpA family protein disulfide reductase [Nitrospirota bacterium]